MDFQAVLSIANRVTSELNEAWDERIMVILRYCTQSHGWSAFPKIGKKHADAGNPDGMQDYLKVYLQRYYRARKERLGLKEVSTVADPAVDVVLRAFAGVSENLDNVAMHHRRAMAAENLLGELLERYLAYRLEPHDWIWCAGNTVQSVDFLRRDLSVALQVKNRSNSENSSSSAIRKGTKIQKWYRINAKTAKTMWHKFPSLPEGVTLSEEDFHKYITDYANGVS